MLVLAGCYDPWVTSLTVPTVGQFWWQAFASFEVCETILECLAVFAKTESIFTVFHTMQFSKHVCKIIFCAFFGWKTSLTGNTLDLFALNPFKLQHSQLVSLWKPSHCGYKKWYCHFYSCQVNKSDIWLQFEKNEKNPPEGADMQKNQKQILKLLYLHYWSAPRGPRGVKDFFFFSEMKVFSFFA